MAVQAGEAFVAVRADLSEFGKDVSTGVEGSAKGGKLKGAGAKIGGLLAAGAAASFAQDFLGGAISGARESQAIANQTAQVIKTTGGAAQVTAEQVGELSAELSKKTAVDDELIQSGANLLLTFTKVRNEAGKGNNVFDQTVALANDMSVALGQDMKSSSIQLGKALNDPIRGVSALQRVGVSFTAQQKEQIKTLVESGDTLGAQKLILAELDTQFGGSAAAQADASKRLGVAWGNFQETIGALVIPIVDKLLNVLTPLAQWMSEHPGVVMAVAGVIGGALVLAFTAWAISAASAAVATIAATWPIIAIGAAVAALAAGIIWAYNNVTIFRTIVQGVASFVTGTVWPAIQAGVEVFREIGRVAGNVFSRLREIVESAVRFILRQLDRLLGPLDEVGGKIGGVVGAVGGAIGKIPGLAAGGTVTSSGLTWVGENGPELLRLPRAAQVIPLRGDELAGTGGAPVQLIFQQSGHDPGGVLNAFAWAMAGR